MAVRVVGTPLLLSVLAYVDYEAVVSFVFFIYFCQH